MNNETESKLAALKSENARLKSQLERCQAEYDYAFGEMLKENDDPSAREFTTKALQVAFQHGVEWERETFHLQEFGKPLPEQERLIQMGDLVCIDGKEYLCIGKSTQT